MDDQREDHEMTDAVNQDLTARTRGAVTSDSTRGAGDIGQSGGGQRNSSREGGHDVEMAAQIADDESGSDADANGEVEEDAVGSDDDAAGGIIDDELSISQVTTNHSPSKTANGGGNFSDESDLTDEPDDDNEDAEGEDDEDEGEDEDDEEEDEDDEDDEDEAAKGLAALTSGQVTSISDSPGTNTGQDTVSSGLEGLAVLAAAEAGDESQAEEDTDTDSISGSATQLMRRVGKKRRSEASRRTATRLNEVMVASDPSSDEEEGEEDEVDEDEDEDADEDAGEAGQRVPAEAVGSPIKSGREMSSLIGLSSTAKRNAKPGAAGLLAGAPSITIEGATSAAPSAATSREASPKEDEVEEEGADQEAEDLKAEAEAEQEKEPGTPAQELDEAGPEDDPTTDEAALRRVEAMDSLTKIEIGFALLRDKLYVERMGEVNREGEMILEGTHPDLIHLSNLIEVRRERKLKLVGKWFEQQEKQYERVAKSEEAAAWNNWRNEVVELRKEQMNDATRKRRKLDREKRSLDGPRPARRHQIFETELVRNPDYDRQMQVLHRTRKGKAKMDSEDIGAYVAFPDLRGADDHESWMDMERMGIATDARYVPGMGPALFRPDDVGMDPYAMYAIEQPPGPSQPLSHSGPSGAFVTYSGPPPPQEFAGYERHYENRPGGQPPPLATYVVDGYGRPVSPPPAPGYGNLIGGGQQRSSNRMPDSYAPLEQPPLHHPPPPHTYSKASRRSPPAEERDVKVFGKVAEGSLSRAPAYRPNSPPASLHQNVRPLPSSRPPPSTHFGQQSREADETFYKPSSGAASATKPAPGSSVVARPKVGMDAGTHFVNRRPQEHMFPR